MLRGHKGREAPPPASRRLSPSKESDACFGRDGQRWSKDKEKAATGDRGRLDLVGQP
jgi:hypothetical protein